MTCDPDKMEKSAPGETRYPRCPQDSVRAHSHSPHPTSFKLPFPWSRSHGRWVGEDLPCTRMGSPCFTHTHSPDSDPGLALSGVRGDGEPVNAREQGGLAPQPGFADGKMLCTRHMSGCYRPALLPQRRTRGLSRCHPGTLPDFASQALQG